MKRRRQPPGDDGDSPSTSSGSSLTGSPPASEAEKGRSGRRSHKAARLGLFEPGTKVHVLEQKLGSEEAEELRKVTSSSGGKNVSLEEARVVLTCIRAPLLLRRHVPEGVAAGKTFLSTHWLLDSTEERRPLPYDDYIISFPSPSMASDAGRRDEGIKGTEVTGNDASTPLTTPPTSPLYRSALVSPPASPVVGRHLNEDSTSREAMASPTQAPETQLSPIYPSASYPYTNGSYACQRFSPLVCVNQGLVDELETIRRERTLSGNDRSALSYARALSAIKAYPYKLESGKEAAGLKGVGAKVEMLVDEYLKTGRIAEAESIRASPRMSTLSLFNELYGVGPHTARRLYAAGCRSLEDVVTKTKGLALGESVRESVSLLDEFSKKIPRREVEFIGTLIKQHLDEIDPSCDYVITGGYRRGKPQSNDIDIVIWSNEGSEKGLCEKLVRKLKEAGLVTHIIGMTAAASERDPSVPPRQGTRMDSLDKAFVVFLPPRLPSTEEDPNPPSPIHRRVDLIFADKKRKASAIMGWTGSMMFERDLRRVANERGYKFDSSSITRLKDKREVFCETEEDIFKLFGLDYIPPVLRNADA